MLLPVNLDGQFGGTDFVSSQKPEKLDDNTVTPMHSLKEAESSPPWTEVVRRAKTGSRNSKMVNHEGCPLEYYRPE
jgi:hypothetical protein